MTQTERVARLSLPDGGEAEVVETDGARAVLVTGAPYPPGATLVGESDEPLGAFALKVQRCRRETRSDAPPAAASAPGDPRPRFRVEGRWVNLSRRQRERLLGGPRPDRP